MASASSGTSAEYDKEEISEGWPSASAVNLESKMRSFVQGGFGISTPQVVKHNLQPNHSSEIIPCPLLLVSLKSKFILIILTKDSFLPKVESPCNVDHLSNLCD